MQEQDQHIEDNTAHSHCYTLESFNAAALSTPHILLHAAAPLPMNSRGNAAVMPLAISLNAARFGSTAPGGGFYEVSVWLEGSSLQLSCNCPATAGKLCEQQAQVLHTLSKQKNLRVFFDEALRHEKIKEVAEDYGLEGVAKLDEYFSLAWENNALLIQPKRKELFPVKRMINNPQQAQLLSQQAIMLPSYTTGSAATMIVVLSQHRFYHQLNLELFVAQTTRDGKVKNPLSPLAPLDLIWKTENQQELKFYSAIQKFQHNYEHEKSGSDIEGLKALVKNPLGLSFYYHDTRVSQNTTAASLVAVQLKNASPDLRLYVQQKEEFYEISGQLIIEEKAHDLNSLRMRYHYFILMGSTLYLIDKLPFLEVIAFFKQYNYTLLVHQSKFEEFKREILAKLEHKIRIHYTYHKPASQQQLMEGGFGQAPEPLIYLQDSDHYVLITPVMRYGEVEVPLLSKKQLYLQDATGKPFAVERDEAAELEFMARMLQQHPDFEGQLYQQGSYVYHDCFYLHKDRFLDESWFLDAFEAWQQDNITVLGFNQLSKNKLNQHKGKVSITVNSGTDWFETTIDLKYGKQQVSLRHLQKALLNKSKFVQLGDGTQGLLPAAWIERFSQFFEAAEITGESLRTPKINFAGMGNLYQEEELSVAVKEEVAYFRDKLANFETIREVAVPAALTASLRGYQKQGLNWLHFLDEFGFGGCLADDMGLGKTIQVLAFILSQREKDHQNTNLVVVPTTLIFNWQAEVQKFAPSLKLLTLHGPNRSSALKDFEGHEIILTTYGTLLSDIRLLKQYRFNYVILDESQAIKNPNSQRYKAVQQLQSRNRLVLSGTPLENNTFDIFGQLSFACPGLLGNKQHFKEQYSSLIDKFKDPKRARTLQQKIMPFILRRTKQQVAPELPDKTEMLIYCEMGTAQRRVYDAYAKEFRDFLLSKEEGDLDRNRMHVLQGLTKLRQICNSPALLNDRQHWGSAAAKIDVLVEQIENKAPHHKILVFSQFVGMLTLIKKELTERDIPFEYLSGQTKNRAARVAAFQDNPKVRVFLISLKAGGTGLNLTAADYVYLVDPWWNPAVENQAIDRAYRIGQHKNVVAVRLICPNTIEEKIQQLQETKTALAGDLIKTDTAVLKSLSKEALLQLFR